MTPELAKQIRKASSKSGDDAIEELKALRDEVNKALAKVRGRRAGAKHKRRR